MTRLLIVASGGALGAAARYGVGRLLPASGWPWSTLAVNVGGGLLMGLLAGWLGARAPSGESLRLFLGVGLLGGFTTFSAFSLETVMMMERRQLALSLGYVAASVVLSVTAVFLGLVIARRFFGATL